VALARSGPRRVQTSVHATSDIDNVCRRLVASATTAASPRVGPPPVTERGSLRYPVQYKAALTVGTLCRQPVPDQGRQDCGEAPHRRFVLVPAVPEELEIVVPVNGTRARTRVSPPNRWSWFLSQHSTPRCR
jgi:hypothetical protein